MPGGRRTTQTARQLRAAVVALVLLVVAGGVLALVTAPSPASPARTGGSRSASAGAGGSPPPAGSTTVPAGSASTALASTTTTQPSTTASTTGAPATSVPSTSVAATTVPGTSVPSVTTTTAVPLTTQVPRPPAPPATVPASGVFTAPSVAPYLAQDAKASLDMTAAVFDADTGATSAYWPTLRLTTASSMKLDILEVLLDHAQASGKPLTAAQRTLASKMVEESTNTAAQSLWDAEGGAAAVAAYDAAAGLTETEPNGPGYWGLSTTGASDLVRLMSAVALPGGLLDAGSKSLALGLLTHVLPTQAWGAPAGVPAGVTVAIKNGWLRIDGRWEINTTAWIDGDGRDYVVAVMSWGDPTGTAGIAAVDGLCSRIWDALAPA